MPWSLRSRGAATLGIVALAGLAVAGLVVTGPARAGAGAGAGTITTVAGKSPPGYTGDGGQARDAEMNEPRMLTFDGVGTMYIVDTFNQVVRRVGTDGVITTIAGHSTGYVPRDDADCKPNFAGEGGPAAAGHAELPPLRRRGRQR